ncbi:MAG: Gfo/Idh/MocA family oxidoreductase [Candidatus Latescibacteria bacterium]|nr:Gfo/Idh/MocA family oxidoreductase [Candidatus Latescibacterota bacterium]
MGRSFKLGIIGTGGIAHAHARACQSLDEIELSGVCDLNPDAAREFGETYGAEDSFSSLEAMLGARDLDIAVICTWGHTHAEIFKSIANSGRVKAILCEKPLCKDASEVRDMASLASQRGILLAEAFKFRHHPQHLKMKSILDSGSLGKVHTVRSTFLAGPVATAHLHPDANWRFNRAKGGGSIYDLGCYCIHHARFVLDAEPERVFAMGYRGPVTDVDEVVSAVLEFPGEVTATINIGFRSFGEQSVAIYGDKGVLRSNKAWNNENQPVSVHAEYQGGDASTYDFAPTDQFGLQLRHLCDCLEKEIPHRIPPQNSIHQMQVIDALFRSIESGQAETP